MGLLGQVRHQLGELCGEAGQGRHGSRHSGNVGDQGVVVPNPDKNGGWLERFGPSQLRLRHVVAESGEANHQLRDLLLRRGGNVYWQGIQHVIDKGTGYAKVRGLHHIVIAANGVSWHCGGDRRWPQTHQFHYIGSARGGDQRQRQGELGLLGNQVGITVWLLGVHQGTILITGGQGISNKDRGAEVAGILCSGLGAGTTATGNQRSSTGKQQKTTLRRI
jgi:hypothetical protein